jgi:hypothetical protein
MNAGRLTPITSDLARCNTLTGGKDAPSSLRMPGQLSGPHCQTEGEDLILSVPTGLGIAPRGPLRPYGTAQATLEQTGQAMSCDRLPVHRPDVLGPFQGRSLRQAIIFSVERMGNDAVIELHV